MRFLGGTAVTWNVEIFPTFENVWIYTSSLAQEMQLLFLGIKIGAENTKENQNVDNYFQKYWK